MIVKIIYMIYMIVKLMKRDENLKCQFLGKNK